MNKLTSQIENFFAADDDGEEVKQEQPSQDDSVDGESLLAERSIAEASKATSLEEKEKILSAVRQNVDQIKSDLGELLKNTWATRVAEIET